MSGNEAKYLSYRYAFGRMKKARDAAFHLEAIALAESIISDRLLSHVNHFHHSEVTIKTSLKGLLDRWKSLKGDTSLRRPSAGDWDDLHASIDAWRGVRNLALHRACKSPPGDETEPVEDFIALAEQTSEQGERLARAMCEWFRQHRRPGPP